MKRDPGSVLRAGRDERQARPADKAAASAKSKIAIGPASEADLGAIVRIEKCAFGQDAWTREAFLSYFAQPHRCVFLLAEKDGKHIGYVIGFFHREGRASVDSLAVLPAYRRRGVARALMKRLKRTLRRHGCITVSLAVRLDNAAAIDLYRQLGFRRDRRINDYYEDGAPAWWMKASLAE